MLEAAIVLQLAIGERLEASIIAVLLIFNVVLGVFQQNRTSAVLATLESTLALNAFAKRDRKWVKVPAAALVPGDARRRAGSCDMLGRSRIPSTPSVWFGGLTATGSRLSNRIPSHLRDRSHFGFARPVEVPLSRQRIITALFATNVRRGALGASRSRSSATVPLTWSELHAGSHRGRLGGRSSHWSWVDLKQKLLIIPAEAYKTNHIHVIPLVPEAVAILKSIPKGSNGEYILSSTEGAKPIRGIGKFYRTRLPREIIAHTGSEFSVPFTSHDLRRTVATRLGESLGVGGEQLIKKVLGHSHGSVTAIYNRYGYVKEMRAGLEAWARELAT